MKAISKMIRKYLTVDSDAVVNLWLKASQLAHPFLTPEFLAEEMENTRNVYLPHPQILTWVALVDNQVAGFVSLMGNEIGGLFVDPKFHKQKLGYALTNKAVETCGSAKLEVFKENKIGRQFYQRYGFVETHRSIFERTGDEVLHLSYSADRK